MKPSARQLIEGIDWSLQQRVARATDDKWAASTLRSVHCLLLHLAARVELEGQLLFDDNRDARGALERVMGLLPATGAKLSAYRDEIAGVLARRWRDECAYPTVASMTDENDALRLVVDRLADVLHVDAALIPSDARVAALAEVDGYIRRRLEREQPMFMPAFLATNF